MTPRTTNTPGACRPYLVAGMNWKALDFAYFETGKRATWTTRRTRGPQSHQSSHRREEEKTSLPDDYMQRKKEDVKTSPRDRRRALGALYTRCHCLPAETVEPPQGWLEVAVTPTSLTCASVARARRLPPSDVVGRLEFDPVDQVPQALRGAGRRNLKKLLDFWKQP